MRMPEQPFVVAMSVDTTAFPIMGPPEITFSVSCGRPPHISISWLIGVPMRTRRFDGLARDLPVIVTMRSTSGLCFCTASYTANAVPTFCTTAPVAIGRAPLGTCLRITASISCFSPPCGYFTFKGQISIAG